MRDILIVVAVFWIAQSAVVGAETMYVTDKIEIMLREGRGMEHRIVGVARSNDPVEVIATEGEYAQIRLSNGQEGWVLSRYLTASLPKTMVIENLTKELEQIREKLKTAQQDAARLAEEKKGLEVARAALEKKVQELAAESKEIKEGCADFIALRDSHAKLADELKALQKTAAQLSAENRELRENTNLMWFIFGAGAVLSGFVIGMYLQGLRARRRSQIKF